MKNIHLQLRNLIGQIESAMIQVYLAAKTGTFFGINSSSIFGRRVLFLAAKTG